jgi:hemerythrin-like domain-containing protein
MPDLFVLLAEDHRRLLAIIDDLWVGPRLGESPLRHRQRTVERLVMVASQHEASEEQFLWPVVRDALATGGDTVGTGLAQEAEARGRMAELEGIAHDKDRFEAVAPSVAEAIRRHISYEDLEVLPRLAAVLSEEEADIVGDRARRARRLSPTRPHPHLPPIPGLLKSAGLVAAVLDRTWDFLTRRGR